MLKTTEPNMTLNDAERVGSFNLRINGDLGHCITNLGGLYE